MTRKKGMGGGRKPPVTDISTWPGAQVEMRKLAQIRPMAKNPNTHTLDQIEQFCAAFREFGWTIPIVVDESGEILAGEGRFKAARIMGYTEAPVIVARDWSEAKKRAYVIADNQLARNSKWDNALLKSEVRDIVAAGFDVQLLAFDADALEKLMLDPKPETEEATDVTMKRCPKCGRMSRKVD